jgi:hypothetical protein
LWREQALSVFVSDLHELGTVVLRNVLRSGFVGVAALLGVYVITVITEIVQAGRTNHAVGPLVLLVVLINPLFWVFGGVASLLAICLSAAVHK